MPELDGLEAAKKIRAQSGHQPIIIAISANAYPEDRKLCQEAGMEDFMPKPFELEKVKSMMRAHFPEKSAKKPAA